MYNSSDYLKSHLHRTNRPALHKTSAGFSLIELIISMAVGIVVIAGILSIFGSSIKNNADTVLNAKMNQELRSAMELISNEIHRAGYWSGASTAASNTPLQYGVENVVNDTTNDIYCITYSYEHADNTIRRRGFRLSNNAIEWARTNATPGCTSAGAEWTPITESSMVEITAMTFTDETNECWNFTQNKSCDPCTVNDDWAVDDILSFTRHIDVSITAQLKKDPDQTITLEAAIQVRNPETGKATIVGPGDQSYCHKNLPLQTV